MPYRWLQGPTAGEKLEEFRGSGPGFDFWRLSLSILVMFLHTFFVCYGRFSEISYTVSAIGRPLFIALLPVFFGLSGFLVAASALRTKSVITFLAFRGLRLIPALAVETTIAALIIGPLLTTLPLSDYFTSKTFFAYFGNIVGRVRFELPGVFGTSPEPNIVNLNLWTLHAELECYVIIAAAIMLSLLHHRRALLAIWALATITLASWNVAFSTFETGGLYPPSIFVYSFCTCVLAYVWRDKIILNRSLLLASLGLSCGLSYLPQSVFLNVALLCYVMIYVGLSPAFRISRFVNGDYSYGIYLYSFIVQQALVTLFPDLRVWWIIFPASLVLTVLIAAASWHLIEKPTLGLKRFFMRPSPATSGRYHSKLDRGRA